MSKNKYRVLETLKYIFDVHLLFVVVIINSHQEQASQSGSALQHVEDKNVRLMVMVMVV